MFRRDNYDVVLARVTGALPGVLAPGDRPPTGQALSQARARLVGEPVRAVFEATAAVPSQPTPGCHLFGLLVTAFDGTVLDLAGTDQIAAVFATPSGGRYPQARLVTLVACGTRRVLAAAADSCEISEQALVDRLADALGAGTPNLADRNFFSMARWVAFTASGAHLAWRVKNGAKSLPARPLQVLPNGSALVRLRESDAMLAARRAKTGNRGLRRLPDTVARLAEFTLTVTDTRGRARTSRFRILTTLLDHIRYPASQIAAAYAQRWQIELAYFNLKVTLRGAGTRLRGQTPHLARQEIWGLLVVYNALVDRRTRGGGPRRRSRPDFLHRRTGPDPQQPRRRHTLRSLRRAPRRHRRSRRHPLGRDHRPATQPHWAPTHQPSHESPAAHRPNPQRQLHHRNRRVKSVQSGVKVLVFWGSAAATHHRRVGRRAGH